MISIIVAYDEERVMGKDGHLPWRLPEDMKLFKKTTMGHTVIMGRKTWDSLPKRPLVGRLNIVLSRGFVDIPNDVQVANNTHTYITNDLYDALAFAKRERPFKEVFIIGGLQIYELALTAEVVDQVLVTRVHGKHEGDVRFPVLGPEFDFVAFDKQEHYDLIRYRRNK